MSTQLVQYIEQEEPKKKKKNHWTDNQFARKLNTPEERKAVCDEYIQHCLAGYADHFFAPLSYKQLKEYIKNFPDDFPIEKIKAAKRERGKRWQDIGMRGMSGKIPGFNAKVWEFNMHNMYGWKLGHMQPLQQKKQSDQKELTKDEMNEIFFGEMKKIDPEK